jgi:hypothetical protein
MKLLVALAAGYVIGTRANREDLDDVLRSLRSLKDTDEFRDLMTTLRSHAGHTLRELAALIENPVSDDTDAAPASTSDLVERVRQLAGLR